MNVATTIWTGVIAGFIASLFFFFVLRFTRPSVKLAEAIARDAEGNYFYKVYNASRRAIFDLGVELALAEQHSGAHLRIWNLELSGPVLRQLPGYSRSDPNSTYAWQIRLPSDLEERWDLNSHHIVAIVFARDAVSGTGRLFKTDVLRILPGAFESGRSIRILESG